MLASFLCLRKIVQHQLDAVVCRIREAVHDLVAFSDDLLLDEDALHEGGGGRVNVTFAAITNRSLVQLRVDLEKALDVGLAEEPEKGAQLVQARLAEQHKQLMLSSQRLNSAGSSAGNHDLGSTTDSARSNLVTSPANSAGLAASAPPGVGSSVKKEPTSPHGRSSTSAFDQPTQQPARNHQNNNSNSHQEQTALAAAAAANSAALAELNSQLMQVSTGTVVGLLISNVIKVLV